MKSSTKRIFDAVGSILNISPSGNYSDYRNHISDSEMIGGDWKAVGDYIKDAIVENEQKKASKKIGHQEARITC